MNRKHEKLCGTLNYIEQSLILASTITGYISAFVSLLGIPIDITSSTIGLKIIKKKNKKHEKIVLLAKSKLNSIENLISKA